MAGTEFDWEGITGKAVERLRAPAPPPRPPDSIVTLAQRSWDGVGDGEEKMHVLRHQFKDGETEKRDRFIKLLKAAGAHTVPPTSVSVVTDPERNGNEHLVAWKAGQRRGRGATV
jgi:hypothetical protein